MTLFMPHIPYDPAETVQSYAARLSFFHAGQGPSRLLDDCRVRPSRFAAGDHDELSKFAVAVSGNIDVLQGGTIRALLRHNVFRGEDFSRNLLSAQVRQFCAHCLREDGSLTEWRHRIIWCFLPVPICLRHGTSLLEVTHGKLLDVRDAVASVGGLDLAEASTSPAEGGRYAA